MNAVSHITNSDLILSVSEAVFRLKNVLEKNFPFIWVRGEITDFSLAPSGHMYFAIKDEQAQLKCAWFANRQKGARQIFNPLTGEVFEKPKPEPASFMRNGLEIVCAGRLTCYAQGGICQLAIDHVEPVGTGLLAQIYEDLKLNLLRQGYFNRDRKRALPVNPGKIALITSLAGAAIHDFLRVSKSRGTGTRVRVYPTPVQGPGAAEKIAMAIKLANFHAWADVLVIIRGGGSLEDRWAFNEEILVKAIFESRLPVLTGIGHETDTSLADLTADARAATPTHAAQMIYPERRELWQSLDSISMRLRKSGLALISRFSATLAHREKLLAALSPVTKLSNQKDRNALLLARLQVAIRKLVENKKYLLRASSTSLLKKNPCMKLEAMRDMLQWRQKAMSANILGLLRAGHNKIDALEERLSTAADNFFREYLAKLRQLEFQLAQLDPSTPLKRGYTLILSGEGKIIKSAHSCEPGRIVTIQFEDGSLEAVIKAERKKP